MTTTTRPQLFHFDVNVVAVETAYYAQVSGVGRNFREALTDAADQERAQLAEQGDELVSFELIGGTDETTETELTTEQDAKFEAILDAERNAQVTKSCTAAGANLAGTPLFVMQRQAESRQSDAKKFWDMFNALTMDEMRAYGEYRKAQLAADAAWRAAND